MGAEAPPPGAPGADAGAPAELRARVRAALVAVGGDRAASDPTPAECLAAGEALLARTLDGDDRHRGTALDLLAADALVTRAFELAAARGDDVQEASAAAMRRIAALGVPGSDPSA